ncbi:HupE/UreJ family protein [Bradyrhizobium centrolobii]|uniref:HupE/UreJ family protein n=1 Tax=Bradyrhizobium centrolobii TaxID=1505087 RepID=UPI0010A96B03|nr:HupE/UreJ family protein [Bradyrhizobium centrolobii]
MTAATTALAAVLASATPVQAHLIGTRLGDFYAGALHPATDINDVVLWLALGMLAGSLGAQRGRWLVILFPLGLGVGFFLAATVGLSVGGAATNAALIGALGLLLAAGLRLSAPLLALAGFALAITRGMANASGTEAVTNVPLFAAGLVCAGYATITLVMALVIAFRQAEAGQATAWRGIALRALGGWIAAIGLMMIGFTLAGPGNV